LRAYAIDLALDFTLADSYKSANQKARIISEAWTERNVFCCECGSTLEKEKTNASVLQNFRQ
jgi:hypothetical protein